MVAVPSSLPTTREVSRWVTPVARTGYAAKGLVYLVIGGLAVRAAFDSSAPRDADGALRWLRESTAAEWLLAGIAAGLAAFVLWRLVQAFIDPEHPGFEAKRLPLRFFRIGSAVIYASLAWTALALTYGDGGAVRDEEAMAAYLMLQPMGRWLAAGVGLGIIGYGLYQVWRGIVAKVEDHMRFDSEAARRRIVAIARVGVFARGVVLVLIGGFLVTAAWRYDPSAAGGTEEALRALGPEWLLFAVAVGLVAYGIYQLAEARYRRIG